MRDVSSLGGVWLVLWPVPQATHSPRLIAARMADVSMMMRQSKITIIERCPPLATTSRSNPPHLSPRSASLITERKGPLRSVHLLSLSTPTWYFCRGLGVRLPPCPHSELGGALFHLAIPMPRSGDFSILVDCDGGGKGGHIQVGRKIPR